VTEAYPEVPAEIRRGLMIGAVAGAQQGAHLRYIILDNKKSPEADKRRMAAHAASSLSFWSLGFRQKPRPPVSSSSSCRDTRVASTSPIQGEDLIPRARQSSGTQTSPKPIRNLEELDLPVMPPVTDEEFDYISHMAKVACRPFASLFPGTSSELIQTATDNGGSLNVGATSIKPPVDRNRTSPDKPSADGESVEARPLRCTPEEGTEMAIECVNKAMVPDAAKTVAESEKTLTYEPVGNLTPMARSCTPTSDAGIAIDIDAPSDVEECTVVPAPRSLPRKALSEAKKLQKSRSPTRKSSPGKKSVQRGVKSVASTVTVHSMVANKGRVEPSSSNTQQSAAGGKFRSPLSRLERQSADSGFQNTRRRSPRVRSRSPRREERQRRRSPERVVYSLDASCMNIAS
jgi:hypothetical protein